MDFVRARTQEQIEQRQLDIIQACEALFLEGGYERVNIKAIAEMTAITRSSIYTYYKTKDEIILDLLEIKLLAWKEELLIWTDKNAPLSEQDFCNQFTDILMKHEEMLRYYCLLYTFLETNCRIEKLVGFKKHVVPLMEVLVQVFCANFSDLSIKQASHVAEEIVSYVLGLYPATHLTEKQKEAIRLSETGYQPPDFVKFCRQGLRAFLNSTAS